MLFVILVMPFVRHGYRFGLGPDVPVYLWWTRVGAAQGLSLVGERPGSPALIAVLAGTLHLPVAAVTAGMEAALGSAIGVATAMLVRAAAPMVGEEGGRRAAWVLAGLLAGLFTVHLAAGYLANLAFAAPFVAAGVCLSLGKRRGAVAGAVLLAGGGLAHPQFFLVGALILGGVAAWSLARSERGWDGDAGRVVVAVGGAAAFVGAGMLSMAAGPSRLAVDTSKDGFLRRAGLTDTVRAAYRDRFIHRWTRYVQWLAIPLAAVGSMRTGAFARRLLVSWTIVVVIGAPIGFLTGWYPADRLITFGFSIPALAGVGVVGVWIWLHRRAWLAWAVAAALVVAMASGALIAWSRQTPFVTPLEVERATAAGAMADALPPGTPLVFIVDDADATASFLATRAANVIRASVPPDRVQDVHIYVGTPANFLAGRPTLRGDAEYDALSRLYLHDLPPGTSNDGVAIVLAPFDRTSGATSDASLIRWAPGVFATEPTPGPARSLDPLVPSAPGQIVLAALAILVLTTATGLGWARWAGLDRAAAIALAPGFGIATITLFGITFERLGLDLAGSVGPTLIALVAGGSGYGLFVVQGKVSAPPPPAVP